MGVARSTVRCGVLSRVEPARWLRRRWLTPALVVALLAPIAGADDWPQFRGPGRDDVSKEKGLLKSWPAGGPPLAGTFADAGVGYAGIAVAGGRLISMGGRGDSEYVFALDLKEKPPREVWSARIGPLFGWKGNTWNSGPSATPTVDGDLVFALGGQGVLVCVEAATGKERWRKDLPAELGAEVNNVGGAPEKLGWGFTWSPLVDGDRLVCVPGGKEGVLAALDKGTGKLIWQSKEFTGGASYSSPIAVEVRGVRQYVQLTNDGVTGVVAEDGRVLWRYPKEYSDVLIPTPLCYQDQVYVTGFPNGCDLIRVAGSDGAFRASKVYANRNMQNIHGGVVRVGEHVYGYSEGKGWVCQELKKPGRIVWAERRALARGSLTYADGRLYCYGETDGTVVLVDASAEGWHEEGRFEIPRKSSRRKPRGGFWTHPVVADGKLFLRDQELIIWFDVRGK